MSAEHVPASTATGEGKSPKGRAVPRGMIVLGLLLYAGALISAAAGLVLGAAELDGVPRWVPLLGAVVLAIMATGLFRRRRWAWFSTLAFVGVSAFYLLRATAERGENTIIGLTILALIAGYLIGPKVRAVYLSDELRP